MSSGIFSKNGIEKFIKLNHHPSTVDRALGLVKKQLHVFRLEALSTQETSYQNHELIFLQALSVFCAF
ncbi:MAG: hypothetical protein RLZZ135_1536 [Cyanobacteriota bacterium]|jgi:hypothetical protein